MGRRKGVVIGKGEPKYTHVKTLNDIMKIYRGIRSDVRSARTKGRLTKLYRRAGYVLTLTHSPRWKTSFRGKIRRMRQVAGKEFTMTARLINKKAKQLGVKDGYDERWG